MYIVFFYYFCTMQNIFSHIAYLLTAHECVIIPGFGALVHSVVPSEKVMDEDVFSLSRVSLGFNSELKHNDGLLCDSLKRERNISYNESNRIISEFSAGLIDLLKKRKEFSIPQVGHFVQTEGNKINFSPDLESSANAGQYGFKNFYLPLLSELVVPVAKEETEQVESPKHIMIPLSRRLITAVSVAAVALLFLLFSIPIDSREIPVQYAGMFSSYIPSIPEEVPMALPEEQVVEKIMEESNPVVLNQPDKEEVEEIEEIALIREEEAVPVVNPVLEEKIATDNSTDNYFIIIASFESKSTAEKVLPHYKKEFDSASVHVKNNRSRIYIQSFQDKREAERFLNEFRRDNPKHKDAWLLCNKARG